jgi:hypothetical protein
MHKYGQPPTILSFAGPYCPQYFFIVSLNTILTAIVNGITRLNLAGRENITVFLAMSYQFFKNIVLAISNLFVLWRTKVA